MLHYNNIYPAVAASTSSTDFIVSKEVTSFC